MRPRLSFCWGPCWPPTCTGKPIIWNLENTAPAGCVPGLSGLRILVLSDIHTNLPLLEKAATIAEQARPDMIVFLGDLYTDFLRVTPAGDYTPR